MRLKEKRESLDDIQKAEENEIERKKKKEKRDSLDEHQ